MKSDVLSTDQEVAEVSIGKDHLRYLAAVAEAASDLKLGKRDGEFAELNGGVERLEGDLFLRVAAWECFMSELDERE